MLKESNGKRRKSKGQAGGMGVVFFWIYALVGVITVITIYIVFDNVLWADENSLSAALIPLGLNMSSSPMTTLRGTWNLWAAAFVLAWALALIIRSIIREPDVGLR